MTATAKRNEAHRASPAEQWRYGVEWRRTGSTWYTQKPAPHYPEPKGYAGLAPVYAAHRAEVTRRLGQPQAFKLAGDSKRTMAALVDARKISQDAAAAMIAEARYADWLADDSKCSGASAERLNDSAPVPAVPAIVEPITAVERRIFEYGARFRPIGYATVPEGRIGQRPDPAYRSHGVVQYDRPLTAQEISTFELEPIELKTAPVPAPAAHVLEPVAAVERVEPQRLTNGHVHREAWLHAVAAGFADTFASLGHPIPAKVRLACGFPSRAALNGVRNQRIGECWSNTVSGDDHFEIFISPVIADPMRAAGVLAHELVHAAVGVKVGHKGPFAKLARALGLEGKLTATTEGEAFKQLAAPILEAAGPYPHGELHAMTNGRKKQVARLIKCECGTCGYVVRTAQSWIDDKGAPHCPEHGEMTIA